VGPYQREGDVIQHVTPADLLDHKDTRSGLVLLNRITVDEVAQRLAPALARRCTTAPLIPAHV
jgi:hypothetical protein